jgi:hypothetical protein
MQAVETQTVILYHTDLRGQWPEEAGRALAVRLPYLKRLAVGSGSAASRASLAGIALARHALRELLGRPVGVAEIVFAADAKPQLADAAAAADFSIAHSGPFVGCAAVRGAQVGFDLEQGVDEHLADWVAREATVKGAGLGMRAVNEVQLAPGGAICRGAHWHGRALPDFEGATACVMTSVAVTGVQVRTLTLAELFS